MNDFRLEKLKRYRMEQKYTQDIMAQKIGITKEFYWSLENGKRKLSYENALKIANVLHTTTDYLFREEFESRGVRL